MICENGDNLRKAVGYASECQRDTNGIASIAAAGGIGRPRACLLSEGRRD